MSEHNLARLKNYLVKLQWRIASRKINLETAKRLLRRYLIRIAHKEGQTPLGLFGELQEKLAADFSRRGFTGVAKFVRETPYPETLITKLDDISGFIMRPNLTSGVFRSLEESKAAAWKFGRYAAKQAARVKAGRISEAKATRLINRYWGRLMRTAGKGPSGFLDDVTGLLGRGLARVGKFMQSKAMRAATNAAVVIGILADLLRPEVAFAPGPEEAKWLEEHPDEAPKGGWFEMFKSREGIIPPPEDTKPEAPDKPKAENPLDFVNEAKKLLAEHRVLKGWPTLAQRTDWADLKWEPDKLGEFYAKKPAYHGNKRNWLQGHYRVISRWSFPTDPKAEEIRKLLVESIKAQVYIWGGGFKGEFIVAPEKEVEEAKKTTKQIRDEEREEKYGLLEQIRTAYPAAKAYIEKVTGRKVLFDPPIEMGDEKGAMAFYHPRKKVIGIDVDFLIEKNLEQLKTIALRHEIVHAQLGAVGMGYNYRATPRYRFQENAAYWFSGEKAKTGVFFPLAQVDAQAPLKIFQLVYDLKVSGMATGRAKDKACKEVTGFKWSVVKNKIEEGVKFEWKGKTTAPTLTSSDTRILEDALAKGLISKERYDYFSTRAAEKTLTEDDMAEINALDEKMLGEEEESAEETAKETEKEEKAKKEKEKAEAEAELKRKREEEKKRAVAEIARRIARAREKAKQIRKEVERRARRKAAEARRRREAARKRAAAELKRKQEAARKRAAEERARREAARRRAAAERARREAARKRAQEEARRRAAAELKRRQEEARRRALAEVARRIAEIRKKAEQIRKEIERRARERGR